MPYTSSADTKGGTSLTGYARYNAHESESRRLEAGIAVDRDTGQRREATET